MGWRGFCDRWPRRVRACLSLASPLLAGLLSLALTTPIAAQSPEQLACGLVRMEPPRAVTAILDGETVRLDDASEVRLINALAPRARDVGAAAGTWLPEEATRAALTDLIQGRTVVVATTEARKDRHGRILGHLFFEGAHGVVWVQGRLVGNGLARVYTTPENHACAPPLLQRERAARVPARGLWTNPAYAVHAPAASDALRERNGRFVIIEGQVHAQGGSHGLATLDLVDASAAATRDRRADAVRVVWRRSAKTDVAAGLGDIGKGSTVAVRGWLTLREDRPEIELIAPGQIEVVGRK
jgi:micrococcal nuclease